MPLDRNQIARRAARELRDGMYVNLGIGMPTLVANHIPPEMTVWLQSENGLLGMGRFPYEDEVDADLINAGKQTVTGVPGHSFFSSAESFAMIRGGHMDVAILGAMEISQEGDIANWMIPGKMVKGMGGAMDLVAGVKNGSGGGAHGARGGACRRVAACRVPVTGLRCVELMVAGRAGREMDRRERRFKLVELAAGVSVQDVTGRTTAEIIVTEPPGTIPG